MKIKDIFTKIRDLAPEENQSAWDNCGVQVAGTHREIGKLAVCLEPTDSMLDQCLGWGAEVVVTHHPLYLKPRPLDWDSMYLRVVRQVMCSGAWLYSAHTSLDTAPGGPAFWLSDALELQDRKLLEVEHGRTPVEVSFYHQESIERETADIWANNDGVHSVSQSRTGEIRLVCDEEAWSEVAEGIEFSLGHRPLFYIRSLSEPKREVGFGEVGLLPQPMAWGEFAARITALTGCDVISVSGPEIETVRSVAYCGGSGSSLIDTAARAGADVFITGDMKYHPAVEASLCVMDVGHFSIEEEMMRLFAKELDCALDGVDVQFFKGEDPFRFLVSM